MPQIVKMLSCAMMGLCVAASPGHAQSGHSDQHSQDLYQACNMRPDPPSTIAGDRRNAVFAVFVSRFGGQERTGTATLIDKSGIFLAAAHSVYYDKNGVIRITQKFRGRPRGFNVQLLSNPDNFESEDYVLLKAMRWVNESRFPYPLRFDDAELENGDFFGFEEMNEEPVHRTVTYYSTDDSGRHYQGTILGHSSGALLYDKIGRAFGIVIKHTPWRIDSLTDKSPEAVYKEWNNRATISIFPLEATLDTLKKYVPASPFLGPLIEELQSSIAPDKVPVDLNQLATPLDMIRLIDEVVFGKIHDKWVTDYSAMGELSHRILAAADELCTSTYYYKAWARLDMTQNALLAKLLAERRNLTLPVGNKESKVIDDPAILATPMTNEGKKVTDDPAISDKSRPRTAASKLPEEDTLPTPMTNEGKKVTDDLAISDKSRPGTAASKPPEEGIADQLGANTPDAAARLGVRFLEGALAVPQSDLSQSQVRLAVTLLRRAAAGPDIQQARERGVTNRDYAAIFGNLALAEDLGIGYRLGSREAAEKAIRAAYALGGSPTAYQLGGRYAFEEADPGSAAGLYAQAFAMLSPRNPREQSIREDVVKDFRVAAARAGASPNTDIASFNVAMLPAKGSSSWYPLAVAANLQKNPVSVAQQTLRLRGTIEKVDGNKLIIKTADGGATLNLTNNAVIVGVLRASIADIKEGSYIGSGAVPQPDGTQKAVEVHIFAESQRGTGDGFQTNWDGAPNGTMTNGAVGQTVKSGDGPAITVKYKDGEKKIIVTTSVPIFRFEVGDLRDLKPGAAINVAAATKKSDGTFEAARINVGRNGSLP